MNDSIPSLIIEWVSQNVSVMLGVPLVLIALLVPLLWYTRGARGRGSGPHSANPKADMVSHTDPPV